MAQTHNTILSTGTATVNGYSGTVTTTEGCLGTVTTIGSSETGNIGIHAGNTSYSISNSISNNMNRQVKVAVFTVERDDKGTITSSKFVKEFWVENKNGGSVVLAAAKQLDKDFDPDKTIIREVGTITL